MLLAVLAGVLSGFAALLFEWGMLRGSELLVGRFTHLSGADVFRFHWGVLLLPAIGGLLSGLAVHYFCHGQIGQGTDLLTRAFHQDMGRLPFITPLIKALAAIGVISFGGSAGPEGPIAALGAGIGSTSGERFGLTPRERRILLIAGCGAGVGAIFQCPLGGALFAASVLYREPEFEAEAIVPAVVASVIGYTTYMSFWGFGAHLLHGADTLVFRSPLELIPYAILGPLCGLLSIVFYISMRTVETRLVPASRLPKWLAPAAGGLMTGLLACALPQVMDGKLGLVQNAMERDFFGGEGQVNWWGWVMFFGAIMLTKCIATGFTLGSGASGGVLGPCVFVGGAAGAFLGALCEAMMPGAFPEPLRQSLIPVGMGGVLAASMRTPLAAIVMVVEMTGSYGLIPPLMLVCVIAYIVGRGWGLNHEQVDTMADSPAHAGDTVIHLLERWKVDEVMERDWSLIASPGDTLQELVERVEFGTRPVFAVCEKGRLVGLISVADIHRIVQEPGAAEAIIAMDLMTERIVSAAPDDDLYQVLNEFSRTEHDVIPVIAPDASGAWLGMITRDQVYAAVRDRVGDTHRKLVAEHKALAQMEQAGAMIELVGGVAPLRKHIVQRLLVPLHAVGQSLREADFRKTFGVQVIAVEQEDGSIECPPRIDEPLRTGQRLVALVPKETDDSTSESAESSEASENQQREGFA